MSFHPDFDIPWCIDLLRHPNTEIVETPTRRDAASELSAGVSNSMFAQTLYTPHGIRAQINFQRPTNEPESIVPYEYCYLLSLGTGVDGKTGRAHGGFNSLVLDQMTGTVASRVGGAFAPATATMTVDYKAPIDTPGVILCRGWPVVKEGRKVWVKAVIEDGTGRVLASGKALFISPRTPDSSKL